MRSVVIRVSLLVILLAMGSTFFQVHWVDTSLTSVTMRAVGVEGEMVECLEAGREAKLRFEMRLCRKRSNWLDACAEERTQHHAVSFDSITESYKVVSDRLGDEVDPVAVEIPSRTDAIIATSTAENIPLSFLARDEENLLSNDKAYLQARTVFACNGSVNRTVAHLSQILTLGIVNVVESDSGWVDFAVHPTLGGEPRASEQN